MKKRIKILFFIFAFSLLTFAFLPEIIMGTPASPAVGNWYQQFMPNIGSQQINDIIFLDSLIGFAVSSKNVNPDTSSILRTTNGGDTWQIIQTLAPRRFSRIKFVNNTTGFISGGSGSGTPYLNKTIDGGNSWNIVTGATFGTAYWNDMAVINESTIWLVDANSLNGGVFRTTNGGANWVQQYFTGSNHPVKIYMYNSDTGFIASGNYVRKTTNGGVNWSLVVSGEGFTDMHFVNSLTGYRSFGTMKKTTDGGLNWVSQVLPNGGIIITSGLSKFSTLNKDTIWGVGGEILINSQSRGIIYRTTNGGQNWTFQIPDTAINVPGPYSYIQFTNSRNGWAYTLGFYGGIHTTLGGDPVWLTGIEQISSEIPKEYKLFQNYPNPFNPKTNIKYSIMSNVKGQMSNVKLTVFDITGREIIRLVNAEQRAGTYEVDFSGNGYATGVYFYSLTVEGIIIDTKKMLLVK